MRGNSGASHLIQKGSGRLQDGKSTGKQKNRLQEIQTRNSHAHPMPPHCFRNRTVSAALLLPFQQAALVRRCWFGFFSVLLPASAPQTSARNGGVEGQGSKRERLNAYG